MRIIATSDLHYDIARSKAPTEAIAREICSNGGDVLILVGDSASGDLRHLETVFGLFDAFGGAKLAVAGNHELWTVGGNDSLSRYENDLAAACSRSGFHYLDAEPYVRNGLAVVGNVGWYDYSFRPARMGIPLRFYQHKIAPGAATRYEELNHLLAVQDDISPGGLDVTTRWMDGVRVRMALNDVEFAEASAVKLRRHLDRVHDGAEHVVAAVHHLPFFDLVPHSIVPNFEFATAFLGSELLGETLLDFPKIRRAFCGHSHRRRECRKGHLMCTAIGSTYKEKCYEVVDFPE